MQLKQFIEGLGRGDAKKLANSLGVSSSFLSQMASGRCSISPARCVEIENATNGDVRRQDLRPDDWDKIWPELNISQLQA